MKSIQRYLSLTPVVAFLLFAGTIIGLIFILFLFTDSNILTI